MRVAIYARVSTGSEDQANALEQQLNRLQTHAKADGDTDPTSYVDIASGSRDDRPELSRLLADCSAGLISTVLVTRLDRLSRSSSHGAELLKYFSEDRSPNLIALDDSIDLATPGGRFMARLLISWAEAETDRLSERTRHGHAYRREQRKVFGPRAPYGYQFDGKGGLEADPETFPAAQELVDRFIKGQSLGSLRDWFLSEKGHKWTTNFSLRRWLTLPTLCGARAYGKRKTITDPDTGKKRQVDRPPGEYGEVYWADDGGKPFQPPLLTREQHAYVLSVFFARAGSDTRPLEGKRTRPLTGIVSCADCGKAMEHHRAGKPSPLTLRCKTLGCPSRWKVIREADTRVLLLTLMQMQARKLAAHWQEIEAAQAGKVSEEQAALRGQIADLEKVQSQMQDEGLQAVLEQKHLELASLVKRDSANDAGTFIRDVEAIEGQEFVNLNLKRPEISRLLFQNYLRAEAANGEVKRVIWKRGVIVPGESAVFPLEEGVGFGRSNLRALMASAGLDPSKAKTFELD